MCIFGIFVTYFVTVLNFSDEQLYCTWFIKTKMMKIVDLLPVVQLVQLLQHV